MKALTICQPYAHLIALPDDDDRAKRVENRTWNCEYRGPLLIHAGKSRLWLSGDNYGIPEADMVWGAVIAVCDMRGCARIDQRRDSLGDWRSVSDADARRWPWLPAHQHAEGPFGFVLAEVQRLPTPIVCAGKQGLWVPSADVVAEVHRQIPALTRD